MLLIIVASVLLSSSRWCSITLYPIVCPGFRGVEQMQRYLPCLPKNCPSLFVMCQEMDAPWPGASPALTLLAHCACACLQAQAGTHVGSEPLLTVLLYKDLHPELPAEKEADAQADLRTCWRRMGF